MNQDNHNTDLTTFFMGQISPYLSPFRGIQSDEQSHSNEVTINDMPLNRNYEQQIQENSNDGSERSSKFQKEPFQVTQKQILNLRSEKLFDEKNDKINELSVEEQIKSIIKFMIENDSLSERQILKIAKPFYQQSRDNQFIFQVFMPKFLKLNKTKEEMIKYCMRKAFKFISESFSDHSRKKNNRSFRKDRDDFKVNLQMPFKKNSQNKTMNANFLKKIFSQSQFLAGYRIFIKQFKRLMLEDNESKINFLVQMIFKHLQTKNLQKIQSIKRLPWTKKILMKTQELAIKLLENSQGYEQFEIEERYKRKKQI